MTLYKWDMYNCIKINKGAGGHVVDAHHSQWRGCDLADRSHLCVLHKEAFTGLGLDYLGPRLVWGRCAVHRDSVGPGPIDLEFSPSPHYFTFFFKKKKKGGGADSLMPIELPLWQLCWVTAQLTLMKPATLGVSRKNFHESIVLIYNRQPYKKTFCINCYLAAIHKAQPFLWPTRDKFRREGLAHFSIVLSWINGWIHVSLPTKNQGA